MSAILRLHRALIWSVVLPISLPLAAYAQGQTSEVPTRDQIPEKYTWNLQAIYPDNQAWEADFGRCQKTIAGLAERKGTLGKSADDLQRTLQVRDDTHWLVDKLVVYANQLSDQDTGNSLALGLKNRSVTLAVSFDRASSWIEPELLTLPAETLRSWCQEHASLAVYEHYLDDVIRKKAHTLSVREEELLAMAGNMATAPRDTFTVLSNAELIWPTITDEQGNEMTLSSSRYRKYIRSSDRRVRREAFFGCMGAFKAFENTVAATLNGAVQRDLYFARARHFDSALEWTLFPDNLPVSVYTNLVETINRHLPLLHRWAKLRKQVLELDELHAYDLYQPLVKGFDKEIEYGRALETIVAGLAPLSPAYCDPMKVGFASRWIDVYETDGKRSGAYSWGSYDTQPYILLNYNKTLDSVSTIAHEMGHSMHSFFTHKHQPKIYGDYSYFVAEVASTFNEILLQDYLLRNTDDPRERAFLLNHAIDQLRSTVLRQVMFAEFEQGIHEMAERGEALTAESMGKFYVDNFHKYWGPELVRDPEHAPYWARIPHFYRYFYVYRYATSYCAAAALAEGVIDERPGALDAYLAFLRAGSSDYPLELLKKAGVDMTTPAPIEAAMKRFEQMIEEIEPLLKG
ncbi:MAG: oligoendopeptidase F [Planctomycetota bacterium]